MLGTTISLIINNPDEAIDIKEWIGHGYINKIEDHVSEWGREDCFL